MHSSSPLVAGEDDVDGVDGPFDDQTRSDAKMLELLALLSKCGYKDGMLSFGT